MDRGAADDSASSTAALRSATIAAHVGFSSRGRQQGGDAERGELGGSRRLEAG